MRQRRRRALRDASQARQGPSRVLPGVDDTARMCGAELVAPASCRHRRCGTCPPAAARGKRGLAVGGRSWIRPHRLVSGLAEGLGPGGTRGRGPHGAGRSATAPPRTTGTNPPAGRQSTPSRTVSSPTWTMRGRCRCSSGIAEMDTTSAPASCRARRVWPSPSPPSRLLGVVLVEGHHIEGVEQPDDELPSGLGGQGQDVGDMRAGLGERSF